MAQTQQISPKQVKGLPESLDKLDSLAPIKQIGENLTLESDGTLNAEDARFTDESSEKVKNLPDYVLQGFNPAKQTDAGVELEIQGRNLDDGSSMHTNTTVPLVTQTTSGVMSAADKTKLDSLANIKSIDDSTLLLDADGKLSVIGGGGSAVNLINDYTAQPESDGVYSASYINSRLDSDAIKLGSGSAAGEANTLSIGNSTTQRRIVNVAEGTANTDAANYGQVSAIDAKLWKIAEPESTADIVPGESEDVDFPISGTEWEQMQDSVANLNTRLTTVESDYLTSADIMTQEEFEAALGVNDGPTMVERLTTVQVGTYIQDMNSGTIYYVEDAPTTTADGSGQRYIDNDHATEPFVTIPKIETPSQYVLYRK